jgi:hypothetical protein
MIEELKELILSLESCNYRIGHADASHVTADEDVAERDKLRKKINGLIEELQAEPTAEEVERMAIGHYDYIRKVFAAVDFFMQPWENRLLSDRTRDIEAMRAALKARDNN